METKTVLKNGRFYTADKNRPWASTVVISGERILYVGDDIPESIKNGDIINEYDLKGKMCVPGFIDSHTHPGMVSQSSWHIDMPWSEDPKVILRFISDFAKQHPKEKLPFLYFQYYPTSMFGPGGPKKELLDTAVSDRPCFCQDFGGHLHWVNSKMLEMMEVTKDTPDPVPGLEVFVRDENGEPTGWIKEFAWKHFEDVLWRNIGWKPPTELTPELMLPFFKFTVDHGITALSDGILEGEAQIKAMSELDALDRMNLYYDGIVRFWGIDDLPEKISESKRFQEQYGNKHIKFNTMKLFLDGTNESGNSALLCPLQNDSEGTNYGEIKMDSEELKKCLVLCNSEDHDIQIHMVGDRAFRVACDAVEAAQETVAAKGEKWTMEVIFLHCELIDPDDMAKPAELGITVNWSPHWSGGYFGEEAIEYIGKERWDRMYQFNPILRSGALVTFSSDVVSYYELIHRGNPFLGMQVGHTRIDPEFPLNEKKYSNNMRPKDDAKLSREDLLIGYTISGAKQMHWDHEMGSIETGKLANINILSDDYFAVPADRIKDIKVDTVIFEGHVLKGVLDF